MPDPVEVHQKTHRGRNGNQRLVGAGMRLCHVSLSFGCSAPWENLVTEQYLLAQGQSLTAFRYPDPSARCGHAASRHRLWPAAAASQSSTLVLQNWPAVPPCLAARIEWTFAVPRAQTDCWLVSCDNAGENVAPWLPCGSRGF